jgi:hypothetical protein
MRGTGMLWTFADELAGGTSWTSWDEAATSTKR